jgi:putative polymerase
LDNLNGIGVQLTYRNNASDVMRLPFAISPVTLPIYLALLFNMALCFVNTHFAPVGVREVIVAEIIIIAYALAIDLRRMPLSIAIAGTLLVAYLMTLATFGQKIDPKLLRDLAIPFVFFVLGYSSATPNQARQTLLLAGLITIVVGVIEWTLTATYLSYFDVNSYYVAKGALSASKEAADESSLFISGMRPEEQGGRFLLPFLGDHRVSSIFLEPISMGFFGVISFLSGLTFFTRHRASSVVMCLIGIVIVIFSDSRFGAVTLVALTIMRLIPILREERVLFFAPFAVIVALMIFGTVMEVRPLTNSFVDRLQISGRLLANLEIVQWLGFQETSRATMDSGYAYIIPKLGLVGILGTWILFLLIPAATKEAQIFKAGVAIYICLSLTIGQGFFSIKTAALLWFAMGALSRELSPVSAGLLARSKAQPS